MVAMAIRAISVAGMGRAFMEHKEIDKLESMYEVVRSLTSLFSYQEGCLFMSCSPALMVINVSFLWSSNFTLDTLSLFTQVYKWVLPTISYLGKPNTIFLGNTVVCCFLSWREKPLPRSDSFSC